MEHAYVSRFAVRHGIALFTAAATLLAPGVARAASGGGGLDPSGGSSPGPTASPLAPAPATGVITASQSGFTITTRAVAVLRGTLHVAGQVPAADAGDTVEIERLGRETREQWARTASAAVGSDGTFTATWRVNHIGRFELRAVVVGASAAAADSSASAPSQSPVLTITVYRPAVATIYGPGLYGNRTACGEKLTPHTLGVANRTLPCGTQVAILYHGRSITVPVIDRGPYANGADWDLTDATARRLGMAETETIDAVSLPATS
jgi:rare lipoprotein A